MKKLTFALIFLLAISTLSAQMHQRFPTAYTMPPLTAQAGSIGTTNVIASTPAASLYNVCWVQQVTQAASVSSSLLVTIGWNNGSTKTSTLFSLNGGALQLVADTSNAVNSTGSNCSVIFSASGQAITYATTYVSVGGTPMQYSFYVTIERLQ